MGQAGCCTQRAAKDDFSKQQTNGPGAPQPQDSGYIAIKDKKHELRQSQLYRAQVMSSDSEPNQDRPHYLPHANYNTESNNGAITNDEEDKSDSEQFESDGGYATGQTMKDLHIDPIITKNKQSTIATSIPIVDDKVEGAEVGGENAAGDEVVGGSGLDAEAAKQDLAAVVEVEQEEEVAQDAQVEEQRALPNKNVGQKPEEEEGLVAPQEQSHSIFKKAEEVNEEEAPQEKAHQEEMAEEEPVSGEDDDIGWEHPKKMGADVEFEVIQSEEHGEATTSPNGIARDDDQPQSESTADQDVPSTGGSEVTASTLMVSRGLKKRDKKLKLVSPRV